MATVPMTRSARNMSGLCVVRGARGAVTVIPVTAQYLIFRFRGGYSGCRSVRDVRGYAFISSFLHFVLSSLSLNVYFYPVSRGVTGGSGPLFQPYPLDLPGIMIRSKSNDWNKSLLIVGQWQGHSIIVTLHYRIGCIGAGYTGTSTKNYTPGG